MHHHHHVIQLGAAWEPPVPSAAVAGRCRWTRRFGRPAGLGPGDLVLLVVSRPAVAAEAMPPLEIAVNACSLPPVAAHAGRSTHDITPLLRDRNELVRGVLLVPDAAAHDSHDSHGRRPLPASIATVSLEIVASQGDAAGS